MPIRWDKFTVKAQEAVQRGSQLASEHGNPELQPIHLLAALLEDKENIVPPVLEKIGIGPQAVLSDVYSQIEKLPKVSGQAAQPGLSNEASNLLEQAFKEASNFKDEYVSTEHLLLALTEDGGIQSTTESVGCQRVEPAVLGERRGGGHRVEHPLHARPDRRCGGAPSAACCGLAGAGEVVQVGAFGVVEPQRVGQRGEHAV